MNAAGQPFAGLLALGGNHDVRPFAGQPHSESFANPAAGAGHQGDAAAEIGMQGGYRVGHRLTLSSHGPEQARIPRHPALRPARALPRALASEAPPASAVAL